MYKRQVLLNARSTIPYVSTEQISYLSNVILSETQMLLPLTAFCAGPVSYTHLRPTSLGQASRISGVSPADIATLMVYLERREGQK